MSPAEVLAYLDALRAGHCMSAELVLPGGATIRAVFAPEFPDAQPGETLDKEVPQSKWAGWKGDAR